MDKNKLLDMIDKLSQQQVERLTEIAVEYLNLNTELENTTPKSCPCCGDANARFIKRGRSGQKQRYQCKSCGKRFTFDAGKLTAYSTRQRKRGQLLFAIPFLSKVWTSAPPTSLFLTQPPSICATSCCLFWRKHSRAANCWRV